MARWGATGGFRRITSISCMIDEAQTQSSNGAGADVDIAELSEGLERYQIDAEAPLPTTV